MKNTQNKKARVSLLIKTTGIATFFVFLAIVVLAVFSVFTIQKFSLRTAVVMADNKVRGDIASFDYMLNTEYGELRIENGELINKYGDSVHYSYEIVDRISSTLGIVATITAESAPV